MNFKDTVALKKKEMELWEQQERDRKTKLKQEKEAISLKSIPLQCESSNKHVLNSNINPTLDAIRGIYFFTTLIGDKKDSKVELEQKLKAILLTPNGFGEFLSHISNYLKSL